MKLKFMFAGIYIGGVIGVWLIQTWIGFNEFPFREIGALAWPALPLAIKLIKR